MKFYWWTSPVALTFYMLLPIFLLCGALTDSYIFSQFDYYENYLSGEPFIFGIVGLFLFGISAYVFSHIGGSSRNGNGLWRSTKIPSTSYNMVLYLLFGVTFLMYVIFFAPVMLNPQLIISLFQGERGASDDLRYIVFKFPGITSAMNLGPLCVTLYLLKPMLTGIRHTSGDKYLVRILIALCVMRVFLYSERIALLELMMPWIILRFGMTDGRKSFYGNYLPLWGSVFLMLLFMSTEYFRSWQGYKDYYDNFFDFTFTRIIGYYVTAQLNAGGAFNFVGGSDYPVNTIGWFFAIPFWNLANVTFTDSQAVLAFRGIYGETDFTNFSGVLAPLLDFGFAGGLVVLFCAGGFTGWAYGKFRNGYLLGFLLYPVWFIGILEMLRGFYWGESRFFPTFVTIFFVYGLFAWDISHRLSTPKEAVHEQDIRQTRRSFM